MSRAAPPPSVKGGGGGGARKSNPGPAQSRWAHRTWPTLDVKIAHGWVFARPFAELLVWDRRTAVCGQRIRMGPQPGVFGYVTLDIPIWDWFSTQNKVKQARYSRDAARAGADATPSGG